VPGAGDRALAARSLGGRVAVVTGASGGLGSAISRRLASAGGKIVVVYHRGEERARALVASLSGDDHLLAQAAVDDSAALARLAASVAERYGTVDVLVNNAGITRFIPYNDLDALDDTIIDEIFRVNWRGAFACVRAFRSMLADGGGGVIVNISSISASLGTGSNVAYAASKAALNSMTASLARALAPKIRVVSVSPGLVQTDHLDRMDSGWADQQRARTPLGRLVTPDEVADAVLAVVTMLPHTTGVTIPLDGGRPLD
jgi:3-oxoacyl-[acyl-carrier protein] reductase